MNQDHECINLPIQKAMSNLLTLNIEEIAHAIKKSLEHDPKASNLFDIDGGKYSFISSFFSSFFSDYIIVGEGIGSIVVKSNNNNDVYKIPKDSFYELKNKEDIRVFQIVKEFISQNPSFKEYIYS